MKRADFLVPFLISVVIHLALLLPAARTTPATVLFDKGASAVALNIVPSIAARPSEADAPPDQTPDEEPYAPNEEPSPDSAVPDPVAEPHVKEVKELVPTPAENLSPRNPLMRTEDQPEASAAVASEQPRPTVTPSPTRGPAEEKQSIMTRPSMGGAQSPAAAKSDESEGDFGEKGVTTPAQIAGLTKPNYPSYSRRHGEEGTAIISVEILPNGKRGSIRLVNSSGYARLDEAAISAVQRATFIPAKADGEAVSSSKRLVFTFKLKEARN